MKAMTVKDLHKACASLIQRGEGERKILVSSDDEGNAYHELFYAFTQTKGFGFSEQYMQGCLPYGVSPDEAESDYIILG